MGRIYTVVFEEVAVTAVQDLFNIVAASGEVVVIHELELGQSSDAGDTESEQLNILIHRATTNGTGGTTPTPRPMDFGDAAASFTARTNDATTQGTEGTHILSDAFNVMAGYHKIWTPESRPVISPSGRVIVELQTAPGDSLTMSGTLTVEEIG